MAGHHVYLGTPTYSGQLHVGTHRAIITALLQRPPNWQITSAAGCNSFLTEGFNSLWCQALNGRHSAGIDRFVMLHSDIEPLKDDWLTVLVGLLDMHDLDVVSAVVPIKSENGDATSTAMDAAGRRVRFRQSELAQFPQRTFSAEWCKQQKQGRLLINTGLLAIRLTAPWVEEFHFSMQDRLYKDQQGQWQPWAVPEDWLMSYWLSERGIRYGATTEIPLRHWGHTSWAGNTTMS
jgi:hypothetical protein